MCCVSFFFTHAISSFCKYHEVLCIPCTDVVPRLMLSWVMLYFYKFWKD